MFDKEKLYDEYCVAFVDILGFKSMTSKDCIEEYGEIINNAIERMKTITIYRGFDVGKIAEEIKALQFADSLVLLFEKDEYKCLLAMGWLMTLQFDLATKGVFVRGAICSGQMYIDLDKDIYYGEAWNKAVTQEGKANYPRIIIENNLADMITNWLAEMNESVLEFYLSEDGYHVLEGYDSMHGVTESPLQKGTFNGFYDVDGKHKWIPIQSDYLSMINGIRYRAFSRRIDDGVLRKYYWVANHLREKVKCYPDLEKRIEKLCKDILEEIN